jgi:hypothetical protein
MNKNMLICLATVVVAAVAMGGRVRADETNIREYVELLRADLSVAKVEAITKVINLTDAEAKVFWPIYKEYELALSKQFGDPRLEVIQQFVTAQDEGKLDDKLAAAISQKFFALQKKRIELWEQYHAKISKAVSPVRAAQFVQVEHQIALMVDMMIASEMPAVGAKP